MTPVLWVLVGWWLGGGSLLTYHLLRRQGWAARAIERSYDAGWEDGREAIMAPETKIQLVSIPPPAPGRPDAPGPALTTRRDRPYVTCPRPDWAANIGTGWSHDVIWAPPWTLVDRLPRESWLRALLAEACAMPPHRDLPAGPR